MKTRTWPYGTRIKVKVLSIERSPEKNVAFLIVDEIEKPKEGHILMNSADSWPDAKVNQLGVITFTKGGPTGGYWEYRPEGN